jgi:hypothetical protein
MGQEARAEAQFGEAVKGLGDTLAILAAKEKQKTDEARTEDAFSKYQDSTLEMEYGDKGFTKILGGDAIKQPLVEDYRVKRETVAKEIRDSLGNDDQRTGFDKRAQIVDRQFDARIYRHVSEQSNTYQDQTFQGLIATEQRAAALNWDQPGQIEMSLARTDHAIERRAQRLGMYDRDSIDNQKLIAGTAIHGNVINQMLVTGKDAAASAYYHQVKSELTPEAIVAYGAKVEASSIDGESIRGANTVWNALGPKTPNDPVRLDVMEAWVRDKYSDDPRKMKAAIQDLRSRAVAHNDGQQELNASNQAKVLDAYHEGATLEDLQRMPEYQGLDGEKRVQMRDYIVGRGWTEQQHARAEIQYREGAKATAGFSTYWELSNPQRLNAMSEAQILSLEPVLGQNLTQDLMQSKRKLSSPDGVKAASMDDELFKVIAADAGLKPYEKTQSDEQKEYLGRLKNNVEASIDAAQRQSGKTLNREEKEKLMRSMVDKKVMVDKWGSDSSLPAPVIRPEQRNKIYVPMNEIDPTWVKGAINYMRSSNLIPMDWTDDKAKQAMRGRLERAYAISITGGSSVEGKKALEGEDK